MDRSRRPLLPLLAALALAAAALGIVACGYESDEKHVVEGESVELGELQYNAIFSRYLNRDDPEDAAYLVGQPPPPPGSGYFGVFFVVQNESDEKQPLAERLTIVDAGGEEFEAISSKSLYALPLGGTVPAKEQLPILDSPADTGPLEGSLALFLLPDFVSDSRPLVLHVPGPDEPAEITLDL